MICRNTGQQCENPGCRHGGCQGVSGRYATASELRSLLKEAVTAYIPREHEEFRRRVMQALGGRNA